MAQSSAPEYAARHTPVREFNHAVTGKLVGSAGRVVPGGLAELCMLFHCNPRQRNPGRKATLRDGAVTRFREFLDRRVAKRSAPNCSMRRGMASELLRTSLCH